MLNLNWNAMYSMNIQLISFVASRPLFGLIGSKIPFSFEVFGL